MDAHVAVRQCARRASARSLPDCLPPSLEAMQTAAVREKQRPREMGAPDDSKCDERHRMKPIDGFTRQDYFKHGSSCTSPNLATLSSSSNKIDSRHRCQDDAMQSSTEFRINQVRARINKLPSTIADSTCRLLCANSVAATSKMNLIAVYRSQLDSINRTDTVDRNLNQLIRTTSENEIFEDHNQLSSTKRKETIESTKDKQTKDAFSPASASTTKWKQRPRPMIGIGTPSTNDDTTANNKWQLKKVFLSKMPSASVLFAVSLMLVTCCLLPVVQSERRQTTNDDDEMRANSDLLSIIPPFAPTRRPLQLLHGAAMMPPVQLAQQMPNMSRMQQPSSHHRQPTTSHEQAVAGSSPKFTRTNELDGFLDEMNHKELQTVAAGRPIEDLFQPKPFSGGAPTSSMASHSKPAHQERGQMGNGGGGGGGGGIEPQAAPGPSGLMGSHSEQQIYSDCALILQRTYVKNIEDPKHQLIPFGKTEQACISYKHIDKAVEQAKHKLKFREFAKMRKKAASAAAANVAGQSQAPPPPFEVIHSSLEPPEDLVAAIGEINMAATQIIADQFDLSNDELLNGLPLIDMSKTKFWNICPLLVRQDIKCEMTRFRTFTGHCNNLKHPTWGAAKTPYARYLPPVHPDGIWVPRKSIVSEITFGHHQPEHQHQHHPAGEHSMPTPTHHHRHHHMDDEDDATSGGHAHRAPQPHRFGHLGAASENAIDDEHERDAANLEHAADAELLRESRDDGSHMDMAGSVQLVRRAHPGGGGMHSGADENSLAAHHHKQLMAASQARAQHHHIGMGGPPPSMPVAAAATPIAVHRARSMPQELPSARLVSSVVHRDVDTPNHDFTMLFMSWGQLLDHDMTRAATPPTTIKCCPGPNGEPASKHKLCLPIEVPPGDPFYSKFGVQCLDFRRTLAGVRPNCVLGPRVHQNANTAPIDANFVYGSAQATADALRLFKGGRLRDRDWFRQEGLKPLLPAQEIDPDLSCLGRPRDLFCFLAGDLRVNEQTHLTVLHTLYMREHNRIADRLSELNPHWDDERTFQETRHLMAAGVQHVLINEYIPLLIGRKMTELYNLTVATPTMTISNHDHDHHLHHHHMQHHHEHAAYWHGYDPSVTTSVSNSFAAAAFRQGHTFVQSTIDRFNKFHEFVSSEKLRHLFMRPFLLYQPGVMDELVSGMINRQSQSYDPFMTEELAGHLFQPPEAQFGHDLASINLQRGRDQGLPGYNLFREWCGLPRAETFEQLEPYLTNRTAFLYSKLYKHVDDIDLWSAGIAERKLPGAAIGPTFSCIIARQFSNTRRGDRFWYENPGLPSSFTPDQLSEIKKFTLAKLLCTNADDLPTIQRWAFRMAHPVLNPRVDCAQLPEIDLQYWQEE